VDPLPRNPGPVSGASHLSDRQREVPRLLAEGSTLKEIALLLKITPRTVAFHKYNIMEGLGITNDAGLVRYAVKQGILSVRADAGRRKRALPVCFDTAPHPRTRRLGPTSAFGRPTLEEEVSA
jgi:DNA-binding CsgD family transcriptional regulator